MATRIDDAGGDPAEQLIERHVDFALTEPVLIRLQNRELYRIAEGDLQSVRMMQGHYLGIWARILAAYDSDFVGEAGRAAALIGGRNAQLDGARRPSEERGDSSRDDGAWGAGVASGRCRS